MLRSVTNHFLTQFLCKIFHYLDVDDLSTTDSVSKKFHTALSLQSPWAQLDERENVPAQPDGLDVSDKEWATALFQKLYKVSKTCSTSCMFIPIDSHSHSRRE